MTESKIILFFRLMFLFFTVASVVIIALVGFRTIFVILPILFLLIFAVMFIWSLMLSYKEFEWEGKKISIYAGFYFHNLKIDNEVYDECNTVIYFKPIKLSTTIDEINNIEGTISTKGQITLKVNDESIEGKK